MSLAVFIQPTVPAGVAPVVCMDVERDGNGAVTSIGAWVVRARRGVAVRNAGGANQETAIFPCIHPCDVRIGINRNTYPIEAKPCSGTSAAAHQRLPL